MEYTDDTIRIIFFIPLVYVFGIENPACNTTPAEKTPPGLCLKLSGGAVYTA
jgi:hypothetical protein